MSFERFTSESQTCLDPFRLAWSSASSLLRPVCSCFVHFPIPFRLVCSCFSDSCLSQIPQCLSNDLPLSNISWPRSPGLVLFLESASAGLLLLFQFPFRLVWSCFSNALLPQIPTVSFEWFASVCQTFLGPFRLAWSSFSSLLRPVCSCFCPLSHSLSTGLLLFLRFSTFSNPTVAFEWFTSVSEIFLVPFRLAWSSFSCLLRPVCSCFCPLS